MKGKNMAGARALWRATGLKDEDFDKPEFLVPQEKIIVKVIKSNLIFI